MNTRIALIVSGTSNPWFKVVTMNEDREQRVLAEGYDLGRALFFASSSLGHPLVIPISGPETST